MPQDPNDKDNVAELYTKGRLREKSVKSTLAVGLVQGLSVLGLVLLPSLRQLHARLNRTRSSGTRRLTFSPVTMGIQVVVRSSTSNKRALTPATLETSGVVP